MRSLLPALLCTLALSCVHADARPALTVAIEHGDTATALASGYDDAIDDAVAAMDRGDPAYHWRRARRDEAPYAVVHHAPEGWTLAPDGPHQAYALHAAPDAEPPAAITSYERGRRIYLLPARIAGRLLLTHTVLHGLMHIRVGAAHACRTPGELPDALHPGETCAPGGYGVAASNPRAVYPEDIARVGCYPARPGTDRTGGGCAPWPVPTTELTPLDVAAIRASVRP